MDIAIKLQIYFFLLITIIKIIKEEKIILKKKQIGNIVRFQKIASKKKKKTEKILLPFLLKHMRKQGEIAISTMV